MTDRWLTRWMEFIAPRLVIGFPLTFLAAFLCYACLYPWIWPSSGVTPTIVIALPVGLGVLVSGLEWLITGRGEL